MQADGHRRHRRIVEAERQIDDGHCRGVEFCPDQEGLAHALAPDGDRGHHLAEHRPVAVGCQQNRGHVGFMLAGADAGLQRLQGLIEPLQFPLGLAERDLGLRFDIIEDDPAQPFAHLHQLGGDHRLPAGLHDLVHLVVNDVEVMERLKPKKCDQR